MLSFAGTYPEDSGFWVASGGADQYPLRYGDVFATPDGLPQVGDLEGRWHALLALHPSCELGVKAAPGGVQVARIHELHTLADPQAQQQIRVGLKEVDGRIQVVRANTMYLAPLSGTDAELFADLREVSRVPLASLQDAGRLAVMTHDARIALLRRDIYFRYRHLLSLDDLVALEARRIRDDPNFAGPKPPWAQ